MTPHERHQNERWRAATDPDVVAVIEDAAGRIIAVLDALPPQIREPVWHSLAAEQSGTLSSIGQTMFETDGRVTSLARRLGFDVFIGDLHQVSQRLSERPPWGTIRDALVEVVDAWHGSGRRTQLDRRRRARARGLA